MSCVFAHHGDIVPARGPTSKEYSLIRSSASIIFFNLSISKLSYADMRKISDDDITSSSLFNLLNAILSWLSFEFEKLDLPCSIKFLVFDTSLSLKYCI